MPAQVETPHKPTRRSRRSKRTSGPQISQQQPTQEAELSSSTSPAKRTDQPMRILQRNEKLSTPNPASAVNLQLPPHTPPQPRSTYKGSTITQHASNDSAPEISQNKKSTPKSQRWKQSGSASPLPASNDTPVSGLRSQSTTPKRGSETPVGAYAGPRFHASPAASSLPMPKFFSRSVPNVDKSSSLTTMMEQEALNATSESEESPSQENSQPARNHRAREESPLDIFFRADREAKEKIRPTGALGTEIPDQVGLSASPPGPHSPTRHHSRHPTDGSIGVMFPLEMDGPAPELSSRSTLTSVNHETHTDQPVITSSSSLTEAERKEEHRKAQTEALKQMLFSPRPPLLHNGSAGQRPPSSGLRKELMIPVSPRNSSTPDPPSTPTPSRAHDASISANTRPPSQRNGCVSSFASFTPLQIPSDRSETTPIRKNGIAQSMEADLRRILKLDVIGGEGISSVQS